MTTSLRRSDTTRPIRRNTLRAYVSVAEIRDAIRRGFDTTTLARHWSVTEAAIWNRLAEGDRR